MDSMNKIHAAINALRANGWLDLEEYRLPSQFIDTRALLFKLDELFDKMPACIMHHVDSFSMSRNSLRHMIEEAISVWGPPTAE